MFGVDWSHSETLWLTLTNVALGIVTLVALLSVFGAVAVELYGRLRKNRVPEVPDFHVLHVPDLGLTMADGGEKVGEKGESSPKRGTSTRHSGKSDDAMPIS